MGTPPADFSGRKIRIIEVGPRDGLQNIATLVSAPSKLQFIQLLGAAGFSDIELASFVSAERVPQMADADAVVAGAHLPASCRGLVLCPNPRGLERALAAGAKGVAFFVGVSETFNQRNIGRSVAQSLAECAAMAIAARSAGIWTRAYVSTAFYCPFEGRIDPVRAAKIAADLLAMEIDEVSIADTIGHATPRQVSEVIDCLADAAAMPKLAWHFHDTRGAALANVLAALERGAVNFDSAAGGLGGCPFAPGAAGNLATEDLVYMLHGMGVYTGVDLNTVVEASRFLEGVLGSKLPGRYLAACGP